MRWFVPVLMLSMVGALGACGGSSERPVTPDESDDLVLTPRASAPSRLPAQLDGSRWRWVEAHCTEGPLDLSSRGYGALLTAHVDDTGLTLVTDQVFATESCQHTLLTRATPPQAGVSGEWQIEEVERVAVPAEPGCFGRPEAPRPGEVRERDGRLEVLVQRSQWCNGLEVRMVYDRQGAALLDEEQIVRRYVAHFSRGDAAAVAALFAETGSLLEPFTQTETGDPYRHDGRAAVQAWYDQTFQTAGWRAMRITGLTAGEAEGSRLMTFEYMDPRLGAPLSGTTRFTIAAGEIFEASIELTSEPQIREPSDESGGETPAADS